MRSAREAQARCRDRTSASRPAIESRPRRSTRTSPAGRRRPPRRGCRRSPGFFGFIRRVSASGRPRRPDTAPAHAVRRRIGSDARQNIITGTRRGSAFDGGRGLRALGAADAGVPDEPRRRMGARAQRPDRRDRRFHRCRPRQGVLRRLEQPRVVPRQGRPPVSPELAAAASSTTTSATRSSRSSTTTASRRAFRSRRWACRSARIMPPTRSFATRT